MSVHRGEYQCLTCQEIISEREPALHLKGLVVRRHGRVVHHGWVFCSWTCLAEFSMTHTNAGPFPVVRKAIIPFP